MMFGRRRREQELADAREEALRWYERLGGQVMNLPPGDEPATKQALVDASERYNAAGLMDTSMMGSAGTSDSITSNSSDFPQSGSGDRTNNRPVV